MLVVLTLVLAACTSTGSPPTTTTKPPALIVSSEVPRVIPTDGVELLGADGNHGLLFYICPARPPHGSITARQAAVDARLLDNARGLRATNVVFAAVTDPGGGAAFTNRPAWIVTVSSPTPRGLPESCVATLSGRSDCVNLTATANIMLLAPATGAFLRGYFS